MIKLQAPVKEKFHNFKCGEIFCETPSNYNVACCLCGDKVRFDQFPSHFQLQHISEEYLRSYKLAPNNSEVGVKQQQNETEDNSVDLPALPTTAASASQDIKSEREDIELPAAMAQLEDEKPIDLMEVLQLPQKDEDRKNIVLLENLEGKRLDSCTGFEPWQQQQLAGGANNQHNEDYAHEEGDIFDNLDVVHSDEDDNSSDASSELPKKELKLPCTQCDRTYKSKRSLLNHLRVNHRNGRKMRQPPAMEHKCDECEEVFRSARSLRNHKWKHSGIYCDICGKPFTQPGNMQRHKIRHTGIKAHKCDQCDNSFYTDKELKAHMLRHTGIMPIICEVCGRPCRDHGVLTAHMRRHTGERPAKCDQCGKSFYSVYDLNVHSVTHSTQRPFSCDTCSSTFQTKKALRVHKKLHSQVRNHECKICGKSFVQAGNLYSHMKTHNSANIT